MAEYLSFNDNKVCPTLVLATMSSGKSTLINAIIGTDILPSSNQACTAKTLMFMDNDLKNDITIHSIDKSGKYHKINDVDKALVKQFNESDEITDMIIEGRIEGIKNNKKSLLIIDTPGINNSMDDSHEKITKAVIDRYKEGIILYILNAEQLGTYDDQLFLSTVANKIKECPDFKVIFALNKMDSVDREKEDPYQMIENCRQYLLNGGFENPVIIPVSAKPALVFKKVLNNEVISEDDEDNFNRYMRRFKRDGYSLTDYAFLPKYGMRNETVNVCGESYSKAAIYSALDNTGIPLLENVINDSLVQLSKAKSPQITHKKVVEYESLNPSAAYRPFISVLNKLYHSEKSKTDTTKSKQDTTDLKKAEQKQKPSFVRSDSIIGISSVFGKTKDKEKKK